MWSHYIDGTNMVSVGIVAGEIPEGLFIENLIALKPLQRNLF